MQEEECGTRMLEEYLDKEVFIWMRDNTHVHGILRSFDQYHNVLLENAKEVLVFKGEYSEVESEVSMIRGESIIFLGPVSECPQVPFRKAERSDLLARKQAAPSEDLDYIAL
ncbi:U6 snRNA-associated Sm-like protein LSm1 [Nematocida displodere]|uniref:U6 snRNA-associated Sm-like protein LSm1 n=1 Tax=Nematocida displodere TaxID=1805483 RepID=A0A177EJT6_9MICR|nr:U6 snRNA-associated Sm-like protein LSm1 [Nematocida displodere]